MSCRITLPDGPFEPTWASLRNYQVPRWYQDAKFGIFVHWGVYAVLGRGEWVMYTEHIPAATEMDPPTSGGARNPVGRRLCAC